ncbi:MAG: trypsin-like peptidase domain-containing protein [Gammaproteobacteria bacterium]|nr:trypsin-like peptidase domain-containing protein [Gammaproteobacteria bacterium]
MAGFTLGSFGSSTTLCGKEIRKYIYLMGVLAVLILAGTYIYEFHYVPSQHAAHDARTAQAAIAPGVGPRGGSQTPVNQFNPTVNRLDPNLGMAVVTPGMPPVISANASPPGNHRADGRANMVCSGCHQLQGGSVVAMTRVQRGATVPGIPPQISAEAFPPPSHEVDGRAKMICSGCHQVLGGGGINVAMTPGMGEVVPTNHGQLSFSVIFSQVKQSVVNISSDRLTNRLSSQRGNATHVPPSSTPGSGGRFVNIGSGLVVSAKGYILTNNHVIAENGNLMVTTFVGSTPRHYSAQIVKQDSALDLALLKIEPIDILPVVNFGKSDDLQVGDSVIAIGSPYGLDQTASRGIISGLRKSLSIGDLNHEQLIQTDAAINRGNSGGALIDRNGHVIGVNTAIYTPTGAFAGIGFAIPSSQAELFLGDTLPEFGGEPFAPPPWYDPFVPRAQNIAAVAAPPIRADATPPGSHRDGRNQMPCATCHQIAAGAAQQQQVNTQEGSPIVSGVTTVRGAELESLTPLIIRTHNFGFNQGIFVASVVPGTAAERAGLLAGDVILQLNGRPVVTPEGFAQVVAQYQRGDNLRLTIYSAGQERNIYLVV